MVYFADREPVGPYIFNCGARRTRHLRFNDFTDPAPVPKGTDFSSVITSNVPVSCSTRGSTRGNPRWRC